MPKNYRKNTYHHLHNRAAGKKIFFGEQDYHHFLWGLAKFSEKYKMSVLAYCLLPDQFHLFVRQNDDELTVGKFAGALTKSYVQWIHSNHGHSRSVFAGAVDSTIINDETQIRWLIKYIAQAPVSGGLASRPDKWDYSAIHEYLGYRKIKLVDMEEILRRFESVNEIRSFLGLDE